MEKRYNTLSAYLRARYGGRLGKICVDGGFSCPNRDGTCGVGGCVFCGERGAGEHITPAPIDKQVHAYLASPRAAKYRGYIAYFQNFTNTYAAPEALRERYAAALIDERIRILAVGTRPDCIDEARADVLASFLRAPNGTKSAKADNDISPAGIKSDALPMGTGVPLRRDVWCELGLQTADEKTARFINRGYETARFSEAVRLLHSRGIEVVVHLIIGLPHDNGVREGERQLYNTVRLINSLPVFGVKLHSLYVMRGTRLCELWERGLYTPPEMEEYVRLAAEAIARLRPDIVLHRVTGDCPRELLAAPAWNADKSAVIAGIDEYLVSHELRQGSLYLP